MKAAHLQSEHHHGDDDGRGGERRGKMIMMMRARLRRWYQMRLLAPIRARMAFRWYQRHIGLDFLARRISTTHHRIDNNLAF